ncbi:MAG TPA: toll/interleukin-1 receptor domain-containing protein [Ktedonobacteraceae bacterium]|nr:toll/interleukin-1 receptor domain-containing protein [Ktedonobacteraceae bacterium]
MSVPAVSSAVRIFYSYAANVSRDKILCKKIKALLAPSMWNGLISDSSESEGVIKSSAEQYAIDRADIIVLLISPDYFASERCFKGEMQRAIERDKAGKAHLIPVLLRPSDWEESPLREYTPLPSDRQPITQRSNIDRENALLEVSKEILRVAKVLVESTSAASGSEAPFPLDTIPYGHSRFFTDRADILSTIHTYFASPQIYRQIPLALNGMPCCGKTQIAVEYASLHKDEYQTILWLDATSRHSLKESIVTQAERLSFLPQDHADEYHLFSALKRWLQQHDQWLLILDNLDDLQLMDLFVPLQYSGHVLLTTHSQATGELAYPVPVAEMALEESALFLLRRARIIGEQALRDEASETAYTQAAHIVQEFDGLALALDQAGAYIEETKCGLVDYLELYRQQRPMLLAKRGRLVRAHPASVMKTFLLLFEAVAQESPVALDLLYLFAFLQPDAIPREMVEQGVSALEGPLHALAAGTGALYDALAILREYSLVQCPTDPAVLSIHHIVQTILIEELMPRQRHRLAVQAVRLMNRVFPEPDFGNWPTCERYFSQARKCAENIVRFRVTQKEAAHLLQRLGTYCYLRAYYQDAEDYLRDALRLLEQAKVLDQPAIAQTYNNLALLHHRQGKYQDAKTLYQRAWEIREQVYGPDHEAVAQTLNNLALLYKDEGDYQKAEALYQRALHIHEHTLGPDHPDTAASLNNLAMVYEDQGKSAEADVLYQRAFAIEESTLDVEHPDWALSLNMQAIQYEKQGRYAEAETFYQHALMIQERNGPEHPDIAQTLNNLADLYEVLGRYTEAEEFYQRALTVARQAFGPEHPEVANILNNLGYFFDQQERYQEAEALYQQALTIYESTRGPEHYEVAIVLTNLGGLYCEMKQDKLAEPLLRRGLAIRERVFGQEHLNICQSLSALAELFIYQKRYEQAEPLYQRFINISQQFLGSEHPDVALARERYSLVQKRINEQREN